MGSENAFVIDGALQSSPLMACVMAAAIVAGIVVCVAYARRNRGSAGWKLGLFLGVLATTAVLICPILLTTQDGNPLIAAPLLAIRLLQAIVLDNGFVDYLDGLPQGPIACAYYFLIGCAYVALPVLAALNIYDLLFRHFSKLEESFVAHWLARGRDVYLFNDLDDTTVMLARQILDHAEKPLVLFSSMSASERDAWSTEIASLGTHHVRYLEDAYVELACRLGRPFKFATLRCLALSADCAKNVSETSSALTALRGGIRDDEALACDALLGPTAADRAGRIHLYARIDSPDDELVLDAANSASPTAAARRAGHAAGGQPEVDARMGTAPDNRFGPRLPLTTMRDTTMATYALLQRAPLFSVLNDVDAGPEGLRPAEPCSLDVLVVGSGAYAEEALKAALWYGQMHNVRLRADVVGEDAHALEGRLLQRCPGLAERERFELAFTQIDVQSPEFDAHLRTRFGLGRHLYVIVALEDDALSHEVAMHTRLLFLDMDAGERIDVARHPLIACLVQNDAMAGLIAKDFDEKLPGWGITPFGSRDELFGYHALFESPLERAGQTAADTYDRLYSSIDGALFGGPDLDVGALKRCIAAFVEKDGRDAAAIGSGASARRAGTGIDCLPRILHYSNLAMTLHARYKVWALGIDGEAGSEAFERAGGAAGMSDAAVVALGRCEHDRWTVFYQTEGFTFLDPEQQVRYSRSLPGNNGRHKIEPLKKHSLVCPNDDIWDNYLHAKSGFAYLERAAEKDGGAGETASSVGTAASREGRADGRVEVVVHATDGTTGRAPKGLRLQLLDDSWRVLDDWVVGDADADHAVSLACGDYVVHPASALPGLACAKDLRFTVGGTGDAPGDGMLAGSSQTTGVTGAQATSPQAESGSGSVDRMLVEFDGAGSPLVNPVVYDWAFAALSPYLVKRMDARG